MVNHKEIIAIMTISVIFAFAITLLTDFNYFLTTILAVLIIIFLNVFAKKITAYLLESEIEIKIWEFKRWGYKQKQTLKKSFPAGAFFPIISKILFFPIAGGFVWMASLVFDVKTRISRAAKRHGYYSFSEMSEEHLAYIAGAGIFINLLFAFFGYLLGFSDFAKFSIWFVFFNMIPISDLDGNKIFFGKMVLWGALATITLIAVGYTFFVV